MSGSGWVVPGILSDIHLDVQVGDTHRRSQSIANHGLQRFARSFNRTAVILAIYFNTPEKLKSEEYDYR
jgi:hypothetical protein